MDFLILGPLEVRSRGRLIALGGRRQRALLALLLLRANEVVSVDALVDGLWGERPPRTAGHTVQVFVSDLRKALRGAGEDGGRILTQAPGYRIAIGAGELDLERFERLAETGRVALARGDPAAAAGALADALALWRGDPLADFAYEPFAQEAIARLEELRLSVLEERIAAELQLGRHAELVGELEALAAQHPFREQLRGHLMRALYRAGRQSEALAVYQATRRLLVDELGIDPKPALQELERAILVQDPALELDVEPEKPSARRDDTGLPQPPTPLVGRKRELEELEQLVGSERLVTVTGPGGIGKTRLALAACERLHGRLEDGARFVQLASLTDPGLVPATVALAIELGERPGEDIPETLARALRKKELLLCLDNFEQLLEAAPFLGELLTRCPSLRLLVSSRSPLRLSGEREYPLAPLQPDEALVLFAERARSVVAGFSLETQEETVRAICDRLDRLPLALELAAGRVRLLSPPALLERLQRALPILAGGSRDLPERQQTLRAAIDWSYQLLDPAEQRLFRAVSVFLGGFTLEAAVAVSGDDEVDVLDPLSALIEHSLIVRRDEGDGEPRFELLETIREYAAERLEASGNADEARRRHADYYVNFAQPGSLDLWDDRLTAWLPDAERERANLRAALGWLLEHGTMNETLELGHRLGSLWQCSGPVHEGSALLQRILERPGGDPRLRAYALRAAGWLAHMRGDYGHARNLYADALALWRELDDQVELATELIDIGAVLSEEGDSAHASTVFEEALGLARQVGHTSAVALVLLNLGVNARAAGDYATARTRFDEALLLHRELGSAFGVWIATGNLGSVAVKTGDYDEAERQIVSALEAMRGFGSNPDVLDALRWFASLDAHRGEDCRAAVLLAAAEHQSEQLGLAVSPSDRRMIDEATALVEAQLERQELAAARERGRALTLEEAIAHVREAVSREDDPAE